MDCDRLFQNFINSIADAVMVIEKGCHVAMVNDALLELQGEKRKTL